MLLPLVLNLLGGSRRGDFLNEIWWINAWVGFKICYGFVLIWVFWLVCWFVFGALLCVVGFFGFGGGLWVFF